MPQTTNEHLQTVPLAQRLSRVHTAQKKLAYLSETLRTEALAAIAQSIENHIDEIALANDGDLAAAADLSTALTDRLRLGRPRLMALAEAVRAVAAMPAVLHQKVSEVTRPDGLKISKVSIPLGTIFFIFESRPNVLADAVSLGIKSGNAVILKGGREAQKTNEKLAECIKKALEPFGVSDAVEILAANERSLVPEILASHQHVDLVIARGGSELVEYVRSHTRIPVIAHDKGLCHLYIHLDAPKERAFALTINSKVDRPGVCNALETLLIHRHWPHTRELLATLVSLGVQLRVDPDLHAALLTDFRFSEALAQGQIQLAHAVDWQTEHLALVLNVGLVGGVSEATEHIAQFGSRHTEAICAEDRTVIKAFVEGVDASCVGVNVSTRFNDGGELGLGAEIGISTSKIHAYGAMGAGQLVATRFELEGSGHVRK